MKHAACPLAGQRLFFGDRKYEAGYAAALDRLARLGCEIVDVDIEPFYETARLLYEGPWVAERTITARSLLASDPDAIHPVTRDIILSGLRPIAIDAFTAFYQLERLRRMADWRYSLHQIDVLALPTAPTIYSVKQVLSDPIQLNSRLGTYTNFVNLLDLCGLALPASMTESGVPFGITLLAQGGADARLAEIGRVFHADTALPLGALQQSQPAMALSRRRGLADGGGGGGRWLARISQGFRLTVKCVHSAAVCSKRQKPRLITGFTHWPAQIQRSPDCCESKTAEVRQSRSKCGRFQL